MRKAITILLTAAFVFALAPSAACAATAVKIDALKLGVEVPEGWVVFGRTVDAGDPNLAAYNTTKEKLEQSFKVNNIYFDAFDPELTTEVIITMQETDASKKAFDYNLASEEELTEGAQELIKNPPADTKGFTFTGYQIVRHKQARFIAYDRYYIRDGQKFYGKQYNTAINGQNINISFDALQGQPVSDAQQQLIQAFLDGMAFDEVQKKPAIDWTEAAKAGGIAALVAGVFFLIQKSARKKRKKADLEEKIDAFQAKRNRQMTAAAKYTREEIRDKKER
jgi:hypothetical protein